MKLTICIPMEPGDEVPVALVRSLLTDEAASSEVVVSLYESDCERAAGLFELERSEARLRILPPVPSGVSTANLWIGTIAAMRGEWVTVIRSGDALDPSVERFIAHAENQVGDIDAFAWNSFQIDRAAPADVAAAIAIPIQHHTVKMERDDMVGAFYAWRRSGRTPLMPFGLYHAAIHRSLVEKVLVNSGERSWRTDLPEYEWAARVILYASRLAFSYRPLSAIDVRPAAQIREERALPEFPFDPRTGMTAAVAEIQARVLADLDREWAGLGEEFVRACIIDCMLERNEAAFEGKAQSYYRSLLAMADENLAASFRPPYAPDILPDMRRGLRDGKMLFVNRFIAGARSAQEFFGIVRNMLAPPAIVEDNLEELVIPRLGQA